MYECRDELDIKQRNSQILNQSQVYCLFQKYNKINHKGIKLTIEDMDRQLSSSLQIFKGSFDQDSFLVSPGSDQLYKQKYDADMEYDMQYVGSFLTLEDDPKTPLKRQSQLQIADRLRPIPAVQSQQVEKFVVDSKLMDQDFNVETEPKRKVGYKYKTKNRLHRMQTPHNTHAQIFKKLLICLENLKSVPEMNLKMKQNKQGLDNILKNPLFHDALVYIFENDLWVKEVQRGKASQPQKQENIKQISRIRDRFEIIILQGHYQNTYSNTRTD